MLAAIPYLMQIENVMEIFLTDFPPCPVTVHKSECGSERAQGNILNMLFMCARVCVCVSTHICAHAHARVCITTKNCHKHRSQNNKYLLSLKLSMDLESGSSFPGF